MLENLVNLVKEYAGDAIINNPDIPNEKNDEAVKSTASSIFDGLKNQLANGGLQSVTDLFKGENSASVVETISNGATGDLMKKFGIDSQAAGNIVSQIIPTVMEKFVKKTNDPDDSSFDFGSIISSLTGGGSSEEGGGLLGKLSGLFGGK